MTTSSRHAGSPPAGFVGLGPSPTPSYVPSAQRPGSARLWRGSALRRPGGADGSGRARVSKVFRALPVASATPGSGRPGAHLPQGRGPSLRGGAAPRRPSACQSRRRGRASPRTRAEPAALTWPLSPTGRARPETREERPPPAACPPKESTSRPRAHGASRAPGSGRGGGRGHARARDAGGGCEEAGSAASVSARGAAAARSVLSARSPLV